MKYILYKSGILITLAIVLVARVIPVQASAPSEPEIPSLDEFIAGVMNGEAEELRGVYVPELFAYSVVQQPDGSPAFVSTREDALTQFELASKYGSTGLLAHNYLAGENFSLLEKDRFLYLVYGNGRVEVFVVSGFLRYQALTPWSVTSNFVDLENGDFLSATQLFSKVYQNPGIVVLQTCIYGNGESSWGRLFIIAELFEVKIVQAFSDLEQISE